MTFDEIKDVAIEYFGENNVDSSIKSATNELIIRWPEFILTNTNDQQHTIRDLFANIVLRKNNAYNSISMLRSTLTTSEAAHHYLHSHLPSPGYRITWMAPCFGRGPICNTIATLARDGNDEYFWRLFFMELDRYVRVESTNTIPYRKISELTGDEYCSRYVINVAPNGPTSQSAKDFSNWILDNDKLEYNITNHIDFGYTTNLIKKLTILYAEYCNNVYPEETRNAAIKTFLCNGSIKNGVIYYGSESAPIKEMVSFTFKGKPIELKIIEDEKFKMLQILKPQFVDNVISYLLYKIYTKSM